jgi:hypothetical protein
MMIRAVQNRTADLKRGLALLLLVFIFYGTTVEAAHRHGRVLADPSSAASLDNSEHTSTPLSGKSACSDCLICQLHQNFNTTLLAFRLVDPPKQVRIKVSPAVLPDILSQLVGPTAGRAPPSIS